MEGPYIVQIAKSASNTLEFSFGVNIILILLNYSNCIQCWLYSSLLGILLSYLGFIPLYFLGLNQRMISDLSLTSTLDPLSLRFKVASLSHFYRYYFGHCSDELAACIPPPMDWTRSTWQVSFAHNYFVELSNARIN